MGIVYWQVRNELGNRALKKSDLKSTIMSSTLFCKDVPFPHFCFHASGNVWVVVKYGSDDIEHYLHTHCRTWRKYTR
jgi:hypothetical protein